MDEAGVAGIVDLHAAQHLAHDHFDVLVVDLHALQAVHVLHFVDDVARQRLDAQQAQDVVRVGRAVDDDLALVDHLAVVHQDVLVLGDQVLVRLAVRIGDHQALLALGVLAEGTVPVTSASMPASLGERASNSSATRGRPPVMSRVLEVSCGMRASTSPTPTCWPSCTVIMRADLEGDVHRVIGAGDLDFLARFVEQLHLRAQALCCAVPRVWDR